MNTLNMRIAPLRLNNSEVRIDREGITRETVRGRTVQGHTTQLITISPDGSLIRMQKGKKEKSYSFETLPQEYHREYEECKRILQEVQAEEPRVSYTDHCFQGHRTLELQVMYSDKLRVRVEDCICLEGLSAEELLANTRGIEE